MVTGDDCGTCEGESMSGIATTSSFLESWISCREFIGVFKERSCFTLRSDVDLKVVNIS